MRILFDFFIKFGERIDLLDIYMVLMEDSCVGGVLVVVNIEVDPQVPGLARVGELECISALHLVEV